MASDEKHLAAAAQMAVDEINEAGGVLGRQVEVVLRDGASDPTVFADKARELLAQEGVRTIFGCWMSSSRKAVKPIVEEHNSLLWYPIQYEGLEQSSNIIYTGSCLNQQIEPAVAWALSQGKRRCFLVGSDYVFPRTANSLIRALASQGGGSAIAERYVPLGSRDLAEVADEIAKARPDIVFNTINGDSNFAFFREFSRAVGDAADCPIMSFSFAEIGLREVPRESAGHYACWSYFQSLQTPENGRFLEKYTQRFGPNAVVDDPIATAYTQVYLWKQAVEQARSFDVSEILNNVAGCSVVGPGGVMEVQANHHVKKLAVIGQATAQGRFDVVWSSEHPIAPKPWLGIEDAELPTQGIVLEALRQYPEVIHLNVELDRLVRERTAELEQANQALKAEIADRERAEETMRESNQQVVDVIESINDGFFSLNEDLVVTYFNNAAERLLGRKAEDVVGRHMFDEAFPEVKGSIFDEKYTEALRERVPATFETYFGIAPYEDWYAVRVYPYKDGISVYFQVITERKRAQEALLSEKLLSDEYINSLPGLFYVFDEQRFVRWNKQWESVTGYNAEELGAMYGTDFFDGEDRILIEERMRKVFDDGASEAEAELVTKDGRRIPYYFTGLRKVFDGKDHLVGLGMDDTDRKRAQREREELIAKLEAQNAELERFTYTVSHDLKSPLITIKGYLGMLHQDLAKEDPESIEDDFARISGAADKMDQLLGELLELSRIGRMINPSEDVPLEEVAREALELVGGQVDENGVQVEISPDLPVVFGDRIRLREVLQNLIDNAVKYMGDQSRPRVEIGSRRSGNETICYVRDNGIGIDPRYHERVFALFDQLDQKVEGSGIGLALVKRIVEVHGGRIWVESEGPGHGATFCFAIATNPPNAGILE